MVLEETDLAPWAAAGKTEKRTCRMLLLAIWSALLGVSSWSDFELRMSPYLLIRLTLKRFIDQTRQGGAASRTLATLPSPASMRLQPETTNYFVRAMSRCLFAHHHAQPSATRLMVIRWAQKTVTILDFAIMVFFLLVGNVVKPWKANPDWSGHGRRAFFLIF